MCYRCEICTEVVKQGTPEKRYTTYRSVPNTQSPIGGTRLEIARERKVCKECYDTLGSGKPITAQSIKDKQLKSVLKVNTSFYHDTRGVKGKTKDKAKASLPNDKYTKPKHDKKNQQAAKKAEATVKGKSVLKSK